VEERLFAYLHNNRGSRDGNKRFKSLPTVIAIRRKMVII